MAAFETTRGAPLGAIVTFRIVTAFEHVVKAVKAKLIADRTYGELSNLTPAQLRDIGLGDQDLSSYCRDIARRSV